MEVLLEGTLGHGLWGARLGTVARVVVVVVGAGRVVGTPLHVDVAPGVVGLLAGAHLVVVHPGSLWVRDRGR